MATMKIAGIWTLTILLASFFLFVSYKKLTGNAVTAEHFREWGYGPWLLYFVGALELIGALLLLFPSTTTSGAMLLCLVLTGASFTLLSHKVWNVFAVTSVCFALLLVLAYIRWNQSWILTVLKFS